MSLREKPARIRAGFLHDHLPFTTQDLTLLRKLVISPEMSLRAPGGFSLSAFCRRQHIPAEGGEQTITD
jgi:hypothetical protein